MRDRQRLLAGCRCLCAIVNSRRPIESLAIRRWSGKVVFQRAEVPSEMGAAMAMFMTQRIVDLARPFRLANIFERREAERAEAVLLRQTEQLLRQKEVLLQEMQHRVANSLHIIAGILLLKARSVPSEETRLHLIDAHRRVMSVAAVQAHLHGARQGDHVEMGPYLSKLCESLAGSLIGDTRHVTLHALIGSGAVLSPTAVSIGLVVAELVINALKHAFPDDRDDCLVAVAFEVDGLDWKLVVSDNGVGKPTGTTATAGGGLGSSLIKALAHQLAARVDIVSSPKGRSVAITHATLPWRLAQPVGAAQPIDALA
jgi:two-component sensor histidine kinase